MAGEHQGCWRGSRCGSKRTGRLKPDWVSVTAAVPALRTHSSAYGVPSASKTYNLSEFKTLHEEWTTGWRIENCSIMQHMRCPWRVVKGDGRWQDRTVCRVNRGQSGGKVGLPQCCGIRRRHSRKIVPSLFAEFSGLGGKRVTFPDGPGEHGWQGPSPSAGSSGQTVAPRQPTASAFQLAIVEGKEAFPVAFGGGLVVAPALWKGKTVVHFGIDFQFSGGARVNEQAA